MSSKGFQKHGAARRGGSTAKGLTKQQQINLGAVEAQEVKLFLMPLLRCVFGQAED